MKDVIEYSGYTFLLFNTISFLFGLRSRTNNFAYVFFCVYMVFTLIISFVVAYYARNGLNNLFLTHYYFVLQFLILSLFYYNLLHKIQRKFVVATIILVSVLLIFLYLSGKIQYYSVQPFDPIEVFICSFPVIVFSIIHLYNSLNTNARFLWVNAGILIYLSVSAFIFILGSFINDNKNYNYLSKVLWRSNAYFILLFYVLIFIEWYKNYRPKKVNS